MNENIEDLLRHHTNTTRDEMLKFCEIGSLDHCLASITEDIYNKSLMPGVAVGPKWFVSNTDLILSNGTHWFTVGYHVHWPT